jgi:hypothetical protein
MDQHEKAKQMLGFERQTFQGLLDQLLAEEEQARLDKLEAEKGGKRGGDDDEEVQGAPRREKKNSRRRGR